MTTPMGVQSLSSTHQDQLQSSIPTQPERQPCQVIADEVPNSCQNGDGFSQQPELVFRSRVGRACDECRSRKIKCDGKQPCLHCTILNYDDCTYDRPRKRSKRLSQREIQELELKLQRAKNILKAISPDLDLDNPNLEAEALSIFKPSPTHGPLLANMNSEVSQIIPQDPQHTDIQKTVPLETVFGVAGQLDLDKQGNWSYHGHGSSSAFLRRIGERFSNISDTGAGNNVVLKLQSITSLEETPKNPEDQLFEQDPIILPPKDVALDLISSALDEACALLKFVHEPSFYSMVYRLYEIDPEKYSYEENKFLPLLYASLAVGYLFSSSERVHFGNAHAISQSEKYFIASRQMISITECRDIWSLQAILFLIIFLQSSAKMATCHSYISAAMASSLQMGLHRFEPETFNPIERETRKRIFWTIRTMETYIIAILGLPRTVSDDDIDQEMPLEIDDQYITKDGILAMPDGQISRMAGFNAHTKLGQILGKVVTNVYPTKCMHKDAAEKPRAYIVNDGTVREVERDLQRWARNLPLQLLPGVDSPRKLLKMQHLLRLAFTHVQLVLYRPFLHYISHARPETPTSDQCYTYAAACVDVGRNVIHNTREMEKLNAVVAPYWFSIYTTFCATLSLVFYVWENSNVQGTLQTLKDAEYGRDVLVKLAYRSLSAARHSEALSTIFNSLPEKLGKSQLNQSKVRRKRHTLSSNQDEIHNRHGNRDIDAPYNSPEHLLSTRSRVPITERTDEMDMSVSSLPGAPLNPLPFSAILEEPSHGNFPRFLGPDSIEDLFGPEVEHSGDLLPPNMSSRVNSLSQNFNSLDQYVSMLDMPEGQEFPFDVNACTNDKILPPYPVLGNATFDASGVKPFVPLSPYLFQMYSHSGDQVAPSASTGFTTSNYYMVDQHDNHQGRQLQGMVDGQENLWTSHDRT
ncbi:fungal-specific transcription factor domain-containing protein [Tricladium varicosporioides]|nr:fungal-specific transcription factor domain-containing protein [Hymenoscyphus varicosporioides]